MGATGGLFFLLDQITLVRLRFVGINRKGFLALVPALAAHILQALMPLSSYMGEQRTCVMTSKQLSQSPSLIKVFDPKFISNLSTATSNGHEG